MKIPNCRSLVGKSERMSCSTYHIAVDFDEGDVSNLVPVFTNVPLATNCQQSTCPDLQLREGCRKPFFRQGLELWTVADFQAREGRRKPLFRQGLELWTVADFQAREGRRKPLFWQGLELWTVPDTQVLERDEELKGPAVK